MMTLRPFLLLLLVCDSAALLSPLPRERISPSPLSAFSVDEAVDGAAILSKSDSDDSATEPRPHLIFPGGGLYFYWQAGVVTYLRENGYDLSSATMAGGSAGALTATLTATNVDFYKATQLALDLCEEIGVWDRSGGLQGVWGQVISDWLEELLPENAVQLAESRELALLVTHIPTFAKERIDQFTSRSDLIACCRTSVHIPYFLDGAWTTHFRGNQYIDGSFFASSKIYRANQPSSTTLVLDHKCDPELQNKNLLDAVNLLAPEGIWDLLEKGKAHAQIMEEQGLFETIPQKQIASVQNLSLDAILRLRR